MKTINEIEIEQRRDYMKTLKGCTTKQLCSSLLDKESKLLECMSFITQVYEAYKDKEDRLTIQELGMYQTVKTILNIK